MILWLILTLTVVAECGTQQQPHRCPASCSCSFPVVSTLEVDCSQVSLAHFPLDSLPNNTKWLSIRSSNLTNIKSAQLSALPPLTKLKLHHGNLTSLPSDLLRGLPHLQTLDLTGNQLAHLPPGIFALESLWNVILKDNLFEEVDPDWFPLNSRVISLDLTGNLLSSVPRPFLQRLPLLSDLNLRNNRLQELQEDTLSDLPHLKFLTVMENRLTTLHPATFSHNPKLGYLFLHRNRLQEVPASLIKGLTALRVLFLNENQLRNVPDGLLDGTNSLFQIILKDNPWQCDEKLMYLMKWMKSNSGNVAYGGDVGCAGPPHLKNERVLLLREDELKPKNSA